jgi:hypothetical protein
MRQYGQVQKQVEAAQSAAPLPAGWYPDPITGIGERNWDGIDWSQTFTRDAPQEVERQVPIEHEYELECADFVQPVHHSRGGIASGLILLGLGILVVSLKAWTLAQTFRSLEQISFSFGAPVAGVFLLLLVGASVFKWSAGRFDDSVGAAGASWRISRSALLLIVVAVAVFAAVIR